MFALRDQHNTKRLIPTSHPVPAEALKWTPTDVALYVLSWTRFDPKRDGRHDPVSEETKQSEEPLISVCIPTSTRRHYLHQLMYQNYKRQHYKNKELVVVDTGRVPSQFLQDKAKKEKDVIYRFFAVEDARQDRMTLRTPMSYVPRRDTWSLGFKRNVAAHLARGECIAHFDDDDLYSPIYLNYMKDKLFDSMRPGPDRPELRGEVRYKLGRCPEIPAIVTLCQWHTFDFFDQTFHMMDPMNDPATPQEWKEPMVWGYGFSYMYTKLAWEKHAFPDREDCEDDVFMTQLRHDPSASVETVKLPGNNRGLVAHSYHGNNTGVMEYDGKRRLGNPLAKIPGGFEDLLPFIRCVVDHLPTYWGH